MTIYYDFIEYMRKRIESIKDDNVFAYVINAINKHYSVLRKNITLFTDNALDRILMDELAEKYCYGVLVFRGRARYRVRVGAALPVPPFEGGVYLHPVYGVPFIPGSAVKGLVRSTYVLDVSRETCSGECLESCVELLFGSTEVASTIHFLDAYPVEPGEGGGVVVGDVINPHWAPEAREYRFQPRPVKTISIARGTVFAFTILIDVPRLDIKLREIRESRAQRLLELCLPGYTATEPTSLILLLAKLLNKGLKQHGIGAKTTRGYGRIEFTPKSLKLKLPNKERCTKK